MYVRLELIMGFRHLIISAVFVSSLVLATFQLISASHVLKGSVHCLDCKTHDDLSDIKVQVKCSKVKKLATATTGEDGTFQTELPSDGTGRTSPSHCLAKILGGPTQLYGSKNNMVSEIAKVPSTGTSSSYTISTPLKFYTSCPSPKNDPKCSAQSLGSSKTIDLPLPPEWGLAPSSYYIPFFPIIGIP